MKQTSTKIVFFGSGPVAAESLALLYESFEIEAVITKPRAAGHHGNVPVLELSKKLNLKTFTPNNKQELSELFTTKPVSGSVGVVIDYGIIITQDVIDYFPHGIINSHFSLLPEWRGADPITFAILSGQKKTGVSLMLISAGLDEGLLLGQAEHELSGHETTPELTEELIKLSNSLLKLILPLWLKGEISAQPQEKVTISKQKTPSYSHKLTKEDGRIDWHKPAAHIEREVRAYIEWPKSYSVITGLDVVITKAHVEQSLVAHEIGQPFITSNKKIAFQTAKDLLVVDNLKPAGKKEMTSEAFLAGHRNLLV